MLKKRRKRKRRTRRRETLPATRTPPAKTKISTPSAVATSKATISMIIPNQLALMQTTTTKHLPKY
jgi:hypothetical protein